MPGRHLTDLTPLPRASIVNGALSLVRPEGLNRSKGSYACRAWIDGLRFADGRLADALDMPWIAENPVTPKR